MSPPVISSRPGGNRSFSRRITGTVLLILLVALMGSAIGYGSLSNVAGQTGRMVDDDMGTERVATELSRLISVNIARARALALSSEPEVGDALTPEIQQTAKQIDALLITLQGRLNDPADQPLFNRMQQANTNFSQAFQALTLARDGGLTSKIQQVVADTFSPAARTLQEAVTQLETSRRAKIDDSVLTISDGSELARWGLVLFSVCALVMGALLSAWLARSITRPIQQAVDAANRVAALDLSTLIDGHERDEAGQLLMALGRMQNSLNALVLEVQSSSIHVAQGASQITKDNFDFSSRTEVTASSLQRTAASVEQITATMLASLEAASRGETLANSAAVLAADGSAAMSEVMHTMGEIDHSSRKIMEITGVIDSIAFQTNILALNAAVEAARAGDQGRGFAVVATEVRVLANRSASAAKEIKALMGFSAEKVKLGTDRASKARDTMTNIVNSVSIVAQALGQITVDSRDQSNNMADINQSVKRLDHMTLQNAAGVEESALSARRLQEQADDLRHVVGRFRLPSVMLALR